MKDNEVETNEAINDPKPGMYFHEMFNPVCVVLEVKDNAITICNNTEGFWDLNRTVTMRLDAWQEWMRYKSKGMNHMPIGRLGKAHDWAVECWKEKQLPPPKDEHEERTRVLLRIAEHIEAR